MLDWIDAGVRASLATYAELAGVRAPVHPPFVGPRYEPLARRTISSVELDSSAVLDRVGFTIEEDWWTTGIGNQDLWRLCDDTLIRDCTVERGEKWASRSYRMQTGHRIIHTAFRGTFPEHDLYWNLAGVDRGEAGYSAPPTLLIAGCYFQDTGSQNVQLVQRTHDWYGPTPPEDITPGGPLVVMDTLSRNAGLGLEHPLGIDGGGYRGDPRPAFAFTFFRSLHNVFIRRLMVDKTMQSRSSGLLIVEGRPRCVVDGSVFLSGKSEQPLAIFRDIDELVIRNSFWHAREGQNWISLERCRRVTIESCRGNTRIQKDGAMLAGTITNGLVYNTAQ